MKRQVVCLALFAIFLQVVAASIITQAPLPVNNGQDTNDRATVYDFDPKWSPLGLTNGATNYITVYGCGFKAHAEAVCLFDFEFTSIYSRIVDDNTIICELPELEISQFFTLPQYSRLDILFDGDYVTEAVYAGQFRWGPELKDSALSATRGPTSGGPSISIFGQGFQDPVLTALGGFKVFFDGVEASASVTSDTVITATPPPVSELGIEALVSVLFFGDLEDRGPVEVYLHARQYFYYGPQFTGISPACAFLNTSRQLTINGVGFDDPLFVSTVTSPEGGSSFGNGRVLLEIEVNGFSAPTWTDSSLQDTPAIPTVLQTYGTVSSGTQITFSSPNWFAGVSAPTPSQIGSLLGKTASVTILWRQTRRLTSNSNALSYYHGPKPTGLSNQHWYYGGDNICLEGCGFTDPNFAASVNADLVQLFISSNPLWDLSSTKTLSDNALCYDILADVACGSSLTVTAQITGTNFIASTNWNAGIPIGNYAAGPAIDPFQSYYTTVSQGSATINGFHLGYSQASHNTINTWSAGVFLTTSSQSSKSGNFLNSNVNLLTAAPSGYQIVLASSGDEFITLNFNGVATFGEVFTLSFRFGSVCNAGTARVSFGPTCDSTFQSGPLTGSSPVTITGTGLASYATAIKLCDSFANINQASVSPSPSGFWDDAINPCHVQENSGEPVGTVEFYNTGSSYVASPSATTSGLFSLPDAFRGKRNWGQIFDIVLMVNSVQDDTFTDVFSSTPLVRSSYAVNWTQCVDYDATRHSGTNKVTSCITATSIACGQYRFGPITDSFTPCQGPVGPEDAYITPVTFTGSDFDDAWAEVPRAINPHLVSFGTLFGSPIVSSISSGSMSTSTVWGGIAVDDSSQYGQTPYTSVAVFFDTCNITVVPHLTVYWGPQFLPCPIRVDTAATGLEQYNDTGSCDIYGFLPTGFYPTAEDTIEIEGYNFYESNNNFGPVRCIIDGVESRVTSVTNIHSTARYTIRCEVPPRPFNTRAKVCVAFSTFYANSDFNYQEPESLFTFGTQDAYSSERVLCVEDQVIVYSPLLLPIDSETYTGHTSGTTNGATAETFDVFCLGCENYWLSGNVDHWAPTFWVGGYQTKADFDNVNTITFDVPTFVAEFNTDVSIAISWEALHNQSYYESPNTYNISEFHDDFFKVWAPFTYHYGPSCDGPATSNVFLFGTNDGSDPATGGTLSTLTMSVSHFQDCYDFDSLCIDDSSFAGCKQPQYSSGFQHPFTTAGTGSRTCLHRNVTLRMDNVLGGASYTDIQKTDDTLDGVNTDTSFQFILPNRGNAIDCDTYEFTFDFYDALVTNPAQRTITCDGVLTYGPGAPSIGGFYIYTINSVPTIYGWGQNRQTTVSSTNDDSFVSVTYTTDPYLNASWHLDVKFGTTTVVGSNTHSGGPDNYDVPNGSWKSVVQISSAWNSGSRSVCAFNGPKFHYGPEILFGSRDNCLGSLLCTGASGQALTITGRALFCCGYNNVPPTDGALYQHRCGWSALSGRSFFTDSIFVPTSRVVCPSASCSSVESVTCTIPDNNQANAASKRLVGFGLFYGASTTANPGDGQASTWCNSGTCDISNAGNLLPYATFDNAATSSENNVMQVCWGPKFAPREFRTRYSGYAPRTFSSLVDPDDTDSFVLGLVGSSCTEINSVNINSTYPTAYHSCAYSGDDGSETTISNDLGECPSRLFAKLCDATDDTLVVTFLSLSPEDGSGTNYQYTPHEFVTTGNERGDFFAEGNTPIENTVAYGPIVTGWDTSSGSPYWSDVLTQNGTELHFPLHPTDLGVQITVDLAYADDWIAPVSVATPVASSPTTMWGTELGVCLFGVLDTAAPAYLLASSPSDVSYVPKFYPLEWTATNQIQITCDVPNGQFNQHGQVFVLLDPHSDSYTQHYLSGDPQAVLGRAGYWFWTPYVDSLSSPWSALEGDEPVTFYGYGFSGYTNVICDFGGFEALQGDIVSDNLIICQSPSSAVPQTSTVTFTFTDAANGNCQLDTFSDCGAPITATLSNAYTFTGVTNYAPRAGPVQGNTTIFFQQVGFSYYDSIDCVIEHPSGAETIPATPATADLNGDWQCVTTAVSAPETSQISLIGHYQNFLGSTTYSVNLGCVYFDYEWPRITSISPSSLTFGNTASVSIRIAGDYFNGGSNTAEYSCNWQHGTNPDSDLPAELGVPPTFPSGNTYTTPATLVATTTSRDGLSVATFDVVCSTPASGFAQIGSYPFELIFSGSATANSLTFDITEQALSTSAISPDTIADFDINRTLTITGAGFDGGRKLSADHSASYLCRTVAPDGSVIIGAANYISDTEVECVAAPANVTQAFLDYKNANKKNCKRYVDPGTTNPTPNSKNKVCYSPTFEFEVSVSVDGGYTWSNTQTLNVFHKELCKASPASSLFVSFVLIPLFALFFFFMI